MDRPKFSIEEGIKVQDENLANWKPKLKEEVYNSLFLRAKRDNSKAKDGYDIFRGQDIDRFVLNYKPKKLWRYTNSTTTIWCSFDCGEVEAYTKEEALKLAKEEIVYSLSKVNDVLASADITVGYTVEMNLDNIEIEEIFIRD